MDWIKFFDKELTGTKRPGIDKIIAWLHTTDFYTAPASTRFHGAKKGGLLDHSISVYYNLLTLRENIDFDKDSEHTINNQSIAVAALLHDVCKADLYKTSTRNVKNEKTGQWEKQPYYTIDDQCPLGHGEKSVILLQQHGLQLTENEIYAIRWHMGGFDETGRAYGGAMALSNAMSRCRLLVLLHMADLAASYISEV